MSEKQSRSNDRTLSFRCGKVLLRDFQKACKNQDVTASQVLRQSMRDFIQQHKQGET